MRKYWIVLLLLAPALSFAQGNADSLRFEMIRATVNFLAKDPKTSLDRQFTVPCKEVNYTCLESSIDNKKLKGVLAKVREWDAKKKGNTPADLTQLKTNILEEVASNKKAYRRTLAGYSGYAAALQHLANSSSAAAAPQTATPVTVAAKPTSKPTPAAIQQEAAKDTIAPDVAVDSTQKVADDFHQTTPKPMQENTLIYVALAASVIAIIISFLALQSRRKKTGSRPAPVYPDNTGSTDTWKPDFSKLETKISELEAKQANDMKIMQRLGDRITELENRGFEDEPIAPVRQAQVTLTPPPPVTPASQPIILTKPAPVIRYAKFSDLSSGGFSNSILMDSQNGEQTYEIQITDNTATYAVTDDNRAQRYALQNYEYLTGASDIKGMPQPNSRISTLTKGTLTRAADGSWLIEKKAVIEFK